ncbi:MULTISPECIES: VCBS domain-containing protein, partial [unclassified Halomonas]|uniref:VCBS domain-containing protein n=1 Tax=unclassified Halomonas TaxID=2609666 RepID=UPI00288518E0
MQTMTVVALSGEAWVRDVDGKLRALQEGDAVEVGDVIVTAVGTTLELAEQNGVNLLVPGGTQVALSELLASLSDASRVDAEAVDDQGDHSDTAEHDASPLTPQPLVEIQNTHSSAVSLSNDAGFSFVRVERIELPLKPLAFDYGYERSHLLDTPEGGSPGRTFDGDDHGVSVVAPSNTEATTPDSNVTDQVVFESGLTGGSAPNASDTQANGQFTLTAIDGLAKTGAVAITYTDVNGDPETLSLGKAQVEGLGSSSQTLTTQYGELVLNGVSQGADGTITIDYAYTLTSAPDVNGDNASDTFTVTVTDRDGDSKSGDLSIKIVDDTPVAKDDANGIAEDVSSVAGNVVTNDVAGADGATVTGITSTNMASNTATNTNGVLEIEGQYGTLTIEADGSYSYALDNSNLDVQGLTPGESLDEVFNYTLTDGDGDEASANLTITIGGSNDGVTVTVPSDTTATSPDGDRTDQVVFESGLADGSAPNALDTQVSSQFTLKAPDGLAENGAVTIGYTDVNGDPQTLSLSKAQVEGLSGTNQTLTTQYGELVLNGVSQGADGTLTIDYDYTLTCAPGVAGDATNDSFSITASDRNGDSHSDDLTIKIVDDAPQARDDANGITEDAVSVAGNVIAGTDGTGTQDADPTQADTTGADGATVTGVSSSNVAGNTATESNGTLVIEGQYGTLTLEADGSYSYVLDNSNLEVQGLIAGESLDEVFNYALTDGDTDVRSANLTLTINGSNDGVTVDVPNDTTASIPDADSTDQVVFESGLADGSAPSAADTQVSSQFTLTALDGLAETGAVTISYIDVNGQPATLSLSKAQVDALGTTSQNITTEYGELVLNGVSQGADGTLTIDYDYTLITAPSLDVEAANDSFTIAATDRDGDTNSDNLTIKIVDDAPVARDDTNSVTEDGASTTTGNVLGGTGVSAGDVTDTPGADGATLAGVTAGVVNTEIIGNLGSSVAGSYGSLVLGTDGVYTYVLNNDDARVNALKDGESLSDIFSYTFKDADGDWSTATITITINGNTDGAPTIAPVDGNGDDSSGVSAIGQATVSEAGLADNSNSHKTDGTLTLTAPDGLASISIGGTKILVSQLEALQPADATTHITIITPLGKLTLTGFTADAVVGGVPVKGTVHYDYELSSPYNNTATAEADNGLDRIDLVVTDVKEASNSGELVVNILDDVPVANADTGTVTEDGAVLEGNVITDAGSGKDVVGADNATAATVVTGVAKGSATGEQSGNVGGTGVTGDYGTLVLNAAGSYSYTLDNDNATVNALKDGETLTETFSYTIKDADGDWSTTILTITIDGTTDGAPSIAANDTTAGVYGDITVKESGLTDGTDASSDSEATNGTITITAPDGLQSITVGGQSFTLAQLNALATTPQTVAVDGGTLELTDFTASSSVGGVPTAGALDYTYTLTDEQTHSGAEDDPLTLKIPLSVTDAGSATTNGTLTVQVEDDAPQAFVDTGSVSEGATLTVTATDGVLSNDTAGADGWDTDGAVIGVAAGNTGTASSGGVAGRIDGQYGYLTLNADGSYEYVSTADAITGDEQDVFTYTVRDGDGDETTATLTINVADVSLAETPITESVNESGLSGGSTDGDSSQIATGTVTLPAGVEAVPQTNVSTGYGEFSIDKDGNYTYTLTDTTSGDAITDSFEYTTQDADGNTVTNTVTISIVDDVPVAQDDTHSITEDATPNPVSGNVLIGGVAAGDAADTQGADGAVVTGAQAGSVAGPIADGNLATAISGQYGTLILQANGGYTYQLDNSNPAVNALKDNDTLADTFSYTLTDGDGDQSTATITITINGNTDGDPSVTIADNNGAAAGDHSIAEDATSPVTGSFTVSAPDGLKSVQVGSKTLTPTDLAGLSPTTPVTVNGTEGALTLIGYNANTGEITYEYQQSGTAKDHRGGDNSVSDSFTITVTDNSDVTSSDALDILITDTAPVAEDDANSITEDSTVAASGNVIGGPNASANDAADTVGADGATVTAIASNNVSGNTPSTNADGDLVIDGEYGTLTIKSDGSYDYVLDNTNLNVQGLLAGENLSETFTYTLTDGDGDTADAILDLTINGANDGVTVTVPVNDAATTPDGDNTDHVVFESGLADGSNPSATDTQVDSSFTLTALDGLAADGGVTLAYINVNGEARTLSLSKAQVEALATQSQTIDTQYGELVLNGYQQAVDGTITIDYNYTLERAPQVAGADTRDNIAITVTDRNGDSNSQSGNVTIKVVDDAPSAVDDANSITEDAVPNSVSGNVVTNDTVGADGANVTAITSTNAPGNTAT